MGEKRAATVTSAIPLDVNAPPGVLGVLDDLSSLILGELATRRKLQAILETLGEQIDVERARFVLGCRLGREGRPVNRTAGAAEHQRLAAELRDYPGLLRSLARGRGTVVENGRTLKRAAGVCGEPPLCVPVCRGSSIVGLLCVDAARGRNGFSPWEVVFCSILANMAGAALNTV